MKLEELRTYFADYVRRYGVPETPVRIQYRWGLTPCEGDLYGNWMIEGFPGMVHISDDQVTDVKIGKDIVR